jgi:anthranilate synthase component 1
VTGTVSGAPKVRAMQLIAELEREKRGVYAGAVGYFGYGSVDGDREIEGAMDVSCCLDSVEADKWLTGG